MSKRPAVSVVVPFHGDQGEAEEMLASLAALRLRPGDEVIVVDNTEDSAILAQPYPELVIVRAPQRQSSYYARNAGVERAASTWLLFLDSDCRPPTTLLDDYFASPPGDRCGVVAGGVRGARDQESPVSAWARSRGHVGERYHVARDPMPAGITANLLVHRAAWEQVGGFHEGVRSGADVEFCWRVQEAGWAFEHRPTAAVQHVHVESLRALLRKGARYGAGRTWMERRYPGSAPRPRLGREFARAIAGGLGFPLGGQLRRGVFKLIDGAWYAAIAWGHIFGDNRAEPAGARASAVTLACEEFPVYGAEPPPSNAAVIAVRRPARVDRSLLGVRARYLEDDPPAERAWGLAWLLVRRPVRAFRIARAPARGQTLRQLAPAVRWLARQPEGDVVVSTGSPGLARSLARLAGRAG